MQITFAGTLIAQEATEGGTDTVTGFMPKRHAIVEWAEFIRAPNATPLARFNRRRSLTGTITPGPFPDLASAAQKLLLNLDALPDSGVLILQIGGTNFTFGLAVLESIEAVKRMGVTVAATLTFQVGPGLNSGSTTLTDGTGNPLTDDHGNPLTSQ